MALSEQQQARLNELLHQLRDDRLSEDEAGELEQLVLADEAARRQYVRAVSLSASLHWMHNQERSETNLAAPSGELGEETSMATALRSGARFLTRPTPFSMIVAAAVIGLLVTSMAFVAAPIYRSLSSAMPSGPRIVARVTAMHQVVWEEEHVSVPPAYLASGSRIGLVQGLAEVTFESGATVLLEGPASLTAVGGNEARFEWGRLTAEVPASAAGFTVHTPVAVARDLGTQFGIVVERKGQTDLHVFRGKVEFTPTTSAISGVPPQGTILAAGQSMRIRTDGTRGLELKSAEPAQLVRRMPPGPNELQITDEYVEAIMQAQPVAYWRFSEEQAGSIANAMSQHHRLTNSGAILPEVSRGNTALSFPRDGKNRHLRCFELDALTGESYTVELWVQAVGKAGEQLALAGTGTGNNTNSLWISLHCKVDGYSIRFLHRSRPGNSGGINIYSQQKCQAGRWHHIAAVLDHGQLNLYLDGQLTGEAANAPPLSAAATHFILGRLCTDAAEGRQFVGRMDEVAIYDRALTSDEIVQHVELGKRAP